MRFGVVGNSILIALLASCSSGSDNDARDLADEENVAMAAEESALGGLDAIQYPACKKIWDDAPTSCGRKLFTTAMAECEKRAVETGGSLIDRNSAGDSWLNAAGKMATATLDERISALKESDASLTLQNVATIPGNGGRSIRSYTCQIQNFKLTHVSWYEIPVSSPL
jgi:hypothetical protein